MARQTGDLKIRGTVDGLCFYRMQGDYFVRRKSSLSGKRFQREAAFAGSRKSAGLLAEASPLASRLYHRLPLERKGNGVFQTLAGRVKLLLKEGRTTAAVEHWFAQTWLAEAVQPSLPDGGKKRQSKAKCGVKRATPVRRQRLPGLFLLPSPLVCRGRKSQPRFPLRE